MSRGRYPVVAIWEAQRKAQAEGFVLILVEAEMKLPFDFVISDRGCISLVRVRRLKYADYRIAEIERLCDREIAEMRRPGIPEEIFRELWARGPDRNWHRYLVLADSIELLDGMERGEGIQDHVQEPGPALSPDQEPEPEPGPKMGPKPGPEPGSNPTPEPGLKPGPEPGPAFHPGTDAGRP